MALVGTSSAATGLAGPEAQVGQHIRVPKSAELVAAQLRRQIIKGDLSEGDALAPESVLLEQFGVSRPTLREAFRVLESEGLISVRRGAHGGARVHPPNADVAARYAGLILEYRGTTVADVYQASAILEPPCAALVAKKRTLGDLRELRRVYAMAEAVKDQPLALLQAQDAFHQAVVKLTGNQTVMVLAGMLRNIVDLANEAYVSAEASLPEQRKAALKGQRAHDRLITLLEAGDAEGAQALWRRHLEQQGDHFRTGPGARTVLDLLD